jgi:hypothetical protein
MFSAFGLTLQIHGHLTMFSAFGLTLQIHDKLLTLIAIICEICALFW